MNEVEILREMLKSMEESRDFWKSWAKDMVQRQFQEQELVREEKEEKDPFLMWLKYKV